MIGKKTICVYCDMFCDPAPTARGWTRITFDKGIHFDCAQRVVDTGKRISEEEDGVVISNPVHEWFELSYSQYLTIPRSVMQAMPVQWQKEMVALLEELDNKIDWRPKDGRYWVRLKDGNGRYVHDPLMNYRYPEKGAIKFNQCSPAKNK